MLFSNSLQSAMKERIRQLFGAADEMQYQSVGGGSINETYRLNLGHKSFFCKVNSATKFPQLFIKEKHGLTLLGKHNIIKVPLNIDCFEYEDTQILILEWIQEGERTISFWKKFGEELAKLHLVCNDRFGLSEDNYMGSVPQSNQQHDKWSAFFVQERLQPMIQRCIAKNLLSTKHVQQFEWLFKNIATIFEEERPALLHGDLWSGNFMCNHNSEPVLIDPAVYYGHRSVDLAMTTLFGGFRQPFYEAYHYYYPFPINYKEQWSLCNFYPLLIHLYLFDKSYLPQIEKALVLFQ